jgi:hypothetical protein
MPQILLNPRGAYRREQNPIAPRPGSLHHKVLGIVDNGKVNADRFLDHIEKRLCRTFHITEVATIRKSEVSMPASFSRNFFHTCDFVVNALGD